MIECVIVETASLLFVTSDQMRDQYAWSQSGQVLGFKVSFDGPGIGLQGTKSAMTSFLNIPRKEHKANIVID